MPIGPGAPRPPQGPEKKSAAPWIALAAAVLLAAATVLVIVLTNKNGSNTADPDPDLGQGNTVQASEPGIRAYPSFEISIDPAERQAEEADQQAAQQVAQDWATALNVPDRDAAVALMCAANQSYSERDLLHGIEIGTVAVGKVSIQGKRATLPIEYRETSGKQVTDAYIPMRLEDAWKVCL